MKVLEIPQSGRHGKKVFYPRGKVQCRRVYTVPADPRTPEQKRHRRRMRSLARAFDKATSEQQDAWSASAARERSRARLGDSGLLTGLQHFTGRNLVLAMVGRKRLLWPPQRVRFGANPVKGLRLRWANGRLRFELKVSGAVTEDVMVFGQAPCSAARKKWRHGAFLCLLRRPRGGVRDIAERYIAKYGEPRPGDKIFIRIRQQRDGWESLPKDVSGLVPAKVTCRRPPGGKAATGSARGHSCARRSSNARRLQRPFGPAKRPILARSRIFPPRKHPHLAQVNA